jgi:putative membrane protein
MKLLSVVTALMGLAVIAGLIDFFGPEPVLRSLYAIGWGAFAAVCVIHLALIAVMGMAWRVLLPGTSPWAAIWGRLVRESGAELLPLSQVGGYVLGARAANLFGVAAASAAASTIVDVTLEFFAEIVYIAIALLWLVHLRPGAGFGLPATVGVAFAAVLAALFLRVQRRGFDRLDRFARMIGAGWAERTADGAAALHNAIHSIYDRRLGLSANSLLHLACWIASGIEVWLALRFAGAPLNFGKVVVLEALVYAARTVAFAVPIGVGAQEGAYVLVGASLGLGPEMALALSFLKRARDMAIGLPTLGALQAIESGRLWRRRRLR